MQGGDQELHCYLKMYSVQKKPLKPQALAFFGGFFTENLRRAEVAQYFVFMLRN